MAKPLCTHFSGATLTGVATPRVHWPEIGTRQSLSSYPSTNIYVAIEVHENKIAEMIKDRNVVGANMQV